LVFIIRVSVYPDDFSIFASQRQASRSKADRVASNQKDTGKIAALMNRNREIKEDVLPLIKGSKNAAENSE
jgi:hypothetical protein